MYIQLSNDDCITVSATLCYTVPFIDAFSLIAKQLEVRNGLSPWLAPPLFSSLYFLVSMGWAPFPASCPSAMEFQPRSQSTVS